MLTIATVIKHPAVGFSKTQDSVIREFGNSSGVEFLIKECLETGQTPVSNEYNEGTLSIHQVMSPDRGVFDGMNQAIELARGDWVLFLNAGDWLADGVGEKLLDVIDEKSDMDYLYFDGVTVDANDEREFLRKAPEALGIGHFYKRAPVLHPCLIVRKSVLQKLKFDTELDLAADFDLMVMLVAKAFKGRYVNRVCAFVLSGGLSEQKRIRARRQACRSLKRNSNGLLGRILAEASYFRFLCVHFIITFLVKPFPFVRNVAKSKSGGMPQGTY